MPMIEKAKEAFRESARIKQEFIEQNAEKIASASDLISKCFLSGGKLLLFGNGGSSTDASHIAAEFVGRYKKERPGLPAIALNTDQAVLTCISNDYDYSEVFARQLKALGSEGDVVIAISTSGSSPNVTKALTAAKRKRLQTIVFTGARGKKFAEKAMIGFAVPSEDTARVQETHITLGHVICQLVEEILFEAPRKGD